MSARSAAAGLALSLLLGLLTGCTLGSETTTYRFASESAPWAAAVDVTVMERSTRQQFQLWWKGGGSPHTGPVNYAYQIEGLSGTISGREVRIDADGAYRSGSGSNGPTFITSGSLTVEWGGKTETIALTLVR